MSSTAKVFFEAPLLPSVGWCQRWLVLLRREVIQDSRHSDQNSPSDFFSSSARQQIQFSLKLLITSMLVVALASGLFMQLGVELRPSLFVLGLSALVILFFRSTTVVRSLAAAVCLPAALFCLVQSLADYPWLVIADNLGREADALARSKAWFLLAGFPVSVALLCTPLFRTTRVRVVAFLVLLAILVFSSVCFAISETAHWNVLAFLTVMFAFESLQFKSLTPLAIHPASRFVWVLLISIGSLSLDYEARVYVGMLPAKRHLQQEHKEEPWLSWEQGCVLVARDNPQRRARITDSEHLFMEDVGHRVVNPTYISLIISPDEVFSLSPDGNFLAIADDYNSEDGSIRIWDISKKTADGHIIYDEKPELSGFKGGCYGLVFFSDNRTLVSATGDDTIRVWDTKTGQEIARTLSWECSSGLYIAASPDDTKFAIWQWGRITVLDAASLQVICWRRIPRNMRAPFVFTYDSLIAGDEGVCYHWPIHPSLFPLGIKIILVVGACCLIGNLSLRACWKTGGDVRVDTDRIA